MPTVREIEAFLFRFAPKDLAMEWDNVGLLLGDPEREARRVLVSLDITDAVARVKEAFYEIADIFALFCNGNGFDAMRKRGGYCGQRDVRRQSDMDAGQRRRFDHFRQGRYGHLRRRCSCLEVCSVV